MPLPSPSSVLLRTQSDERLVVLARAGHERAFEAIVERHRGGMLRVARRYLPDARAEDSIQHAFLAAWSALQRGDDVRDLRAWLHRIARNSALNQLRATGYDYAELEESVRAGDAPADALERRTAMRQTLTGLAALPERQREALLRIAVEGRSQDEVARELGVSSGAVRQLVHRARHTLRAAATAVVPMPGATWLASGAGAETVGGAGAAALLAKGAAVIFATGVAAAPMIVAAEPDRSGHPPVRHAARPSDPSPSPAPPAPTASPRAAGGGEGQASGSSGHDRSGRSRSRRSGSGRSGSSHESERHESPGSDSSGPSSAPAVTPSPTATPGDSGSSGRGGDDSSGSSSSGSGSSGSGSSGSGSSGSSGSGSSSGPGPGPAPTPAATATIAPTATPDNSGPGSLSSGSGSSGDGGGGDSSGHGSSGGPGHG
jgi:RNA polymerase sigma factor (sigma-70 family)